jgi:hypothetical protein
VKFLEKLMMIFPFTKFPFFNSQPTVQKSMVLIQVSFVKTVVIVAQGGKTLLMSAAVFPVGLCCIAYWSSTMMETSSMVMSILESAAISSVVKVAASVVSSFESQMIKKVKATRAASTIFFVFKNKQVLG